MKRQIIFDPEPFCFGPISSTLSLVRHLREATRLSDSHDFVLVSCGTSLELSARAGLFDITIEAKTAQSGFWANHQRHLSCADAYVSNTNPTGILGVRGLVRRRIYIDLLFWMWRQPLVDPRTDVDGYFVQDFPGIPEQCARSKISSDSIEIVNPLIATHLPGGEGDPEQVLVALGGIDTIYAAGVPGFHERLLNCILRNQHLRDKKVIIAGGGNTTERLRQAFRGTHPGVQIHSLDPASFLRTLATSAHVLMSPGMQTYHEARGLGKRVFLLPPHNYSQYQQFNVLAVHDAATSGVNYAEMLEDKVDIGLYLEESEGIERVQQCMRRAIASDSAWEHLDRSLSRYFPGPKAPAAKPARLAGKASGVIEISRRLERMLTNV